MRDQIEKWLLMATLILLALVLWQLVHASFEANPLAKTTIPAVPVLTTNIPATTTPPPNAGVAVANVSKATNSMATGTNLPPGTNLASLSLPTNAPTAGSNILATTPVTNTLTTKTNPVPSVLPTTNTGVANMALVTNQGTPTNALLAGTNGVGTNQVTVMHQKHSHGPGMAMMGGMGFPMGGMGGMGSPPSPLPPEKQAQVDKIVSSEIFAPVFHPLPMALMGIAGDTAFLRTASGQTGLVKVGDSLGEVKLLRIGINRVLVQQGEQKTELTIFDGYGGESLLSTTNGSSK